MDQTDFCQKSLDIEAEFDRLKNSQHHTSENNGLSYSADYGGQLKSVLNEVQESAVAQAKAAHEADLEYQKYKE